ncbi:disulfide bond formation protein B [Rhizobiales bacterium L72]|uniref:Disulfide bond formation protein B n=1 Tax=Propylenella binzhouense TaxID=2555902 RepID=A0A964T199_9HYPH|nr:disulfide bond formation protein B [Propylenella binzhouense]
MALVLLLVSAATILGALGFEHIGGYEPCALCLEQRWPYYVGVPVAFAAWLSIALAAPRWLAGLLLALFAGLMLYGFGLAIYHSGVEWGFWAGPASCAPAGGVPGSAGAMLQSLQAGVHGPSCTEATWRLLGLSFAGWNAIVSALLVAGAALAFRRLYGSSSASQ